MRPPSARTFASLLALALASALAPAPAGADEQGAIAVLPFTSSEKRLEIYGVPVSRALTGELRGSAGAPVQVVVDPSTLPRRVAWVIDGRILERPGGRVVLEARLRDPDRGSAAGQVATRPRPLQEIDHLARDLARQLLPVLESARRTRASRAATPPSRSGTAPGQAATPPARSGTAPGRVTVPGQAATSPGRSGTAPGRVTSPGQAATPPARSGAGPGRVTVPGQGATPSGRSATSPGQAATLPARSGTAPGQAATPPGRSATPPGQAATAPGRSGTASGRATTPAPPGSQAETSAHEPGRLPLFLVGRTGGGVRSAGLPAHPIVTATAADLATRLGRRARVVELGGIGPAASVKAALAGAHATHALLSEVQAVEFVWLGVLTARGRVRLVLVDVGGDAVYDDIIETDTVVGSRGDRHEALLGFVARQAMEIAAPRIKRALLARESAP